MKRARTRGSGEAGTRGSAEEAISNPQLLITHQKTQERKRAARLSEMETMIAALERRLAEIARDLEAAGGDVARVQTLGEEYAQVETELSTRLAEWESLAA